MERSEIRFLFIYRNNNLYWRSKPAGNVNVINPAGNIHQTGYRRITINRKEFRAHNLIWIYHYDEIPSNMTVDHINGIKDDNRIENLRLCDKTQQNMNRVFTKNINNFTGVYYDGRVKKYHGRVQAYGKIYYCGKYFPTAEEANEAVIKLRNDIHGEFIRYE